ncbi:MAG: argininosuccinate lyase, partial [Candidatus Micrarchaeota archaeon]|nr:argininosuccinate lyase [Candidatus Micrarchaeota archaeon]
MKLWEKNYRLNKEIEKFTVGEDYLLDKKLVKYDCIASIAHVGMLGKIGLLKDTEVKKLKTELRGIMELDKKGKFKIAQADEDCHTAIENYLTVHLGQLGMKVHTARSRNDQSLTALRLYYKNELKESEKLVEDLIQKLETFKSKYGEIEFPGYTHTRKAMPSSIGLWSGAFIDSMKDNLKVIRVVLDLVDQSPLGSGAGYGVPIKIDRNYTAKELNFGKVQVNPIYVQNSRGKFESIIVNTLSQVMLDLNKIASDLILFSMPEFGYFILPKQFLTGSSMMPHKNNPDLLEILRGNYHVINSYEFRIKGIVGNMISGYNRDIQLT